MDIQTFIDSYQRTFSGKVELPIAFWYSDTLLGELRKTRGCLFKAFPAMRNREIVSISRESIGCGGGKFYTGFTPILEHVPNFVSLRERHKQTLGMVLEGIKEIDVRKAIEQYIRFIKIDRFTSFEDAEGLLFPVIPDILSGLITWVPFDNNSPETVSTPSDSGCSVAITQTVSRSRRGGHRAFLGFFDPSVRPYAESNILSLMIPMSRFKETCETMRICSLDTHAWGRVKVRIDEG